MNSKDLQLLQEAAEKVTNDKLQAFKNFANRYLNFENYIKDIIEKGYEITTLDIDKDLYMVYLFMFIEDILHNEKSSPDDIDWYRTAPSDAIQKEYDGLVQINLYDKAIHAVIHGAGGFSEFKKLPPEEKNKVANLGYQYLLSFYHNADEDDFKGFFRDTTLQ
jgi:hypothetical protein